MPTSAYAWAVIVLVLVGFAVWIRSAIRRGASAEAQAERETLARLDAGRKADEHQRGAGGRAGGFGGAWGGGCLTSFRRVA